MAEVTVGELAKSIGAPVERFLKQMQEAGLQHKNAEAKVSDDEKLILLNFLKSSHGGIALEPENTNSTMLEVEELTGDKFNRKEYESLLYNLIKIDRDFAVRTIPQLALRPAMRLMPVLASAGHLDFWVKPEKDCRVLFLAQLLGLLLLPIDFSSEVGRSDVKGGVARAAVRKGALPAIERYLDIERQADDKVRVASYAIRVVTYAMDARVSAAAAARIAATGNFDYYQVVVAEAAVAAVAAAEASDVFGAKTLLYDALKMDVKYCQKPDETFDECLLWWGRVPEWFIMYLSKLDIIVTQLPRLEGEHVEEWSTIDAGLDMLWRESGMVRPSNSGSNIDSMIAAGELKDNSAEGELLQLSYRSTNQSHPESPSITDKLNRQKLVNALAINLTHSSNKHHRAIGLLGEWGSGKSTVLKLLKQKLKETHKEQPFIFGEFNAWAYEHSDNIQAGIAQEVLSAVTSLENEAPSKEITDVVILGGPVHVAIKWCNNWFKKLIISVLFRSWITLCYSVRAQFFKLLKSLLVFCIALMPLLIPPGASIPTFPAEPQSAVISGRASEVENKWFSALRSWADRNRSLFGNAVFQLLWFMGFGFYFLRQLPSLFANPLSKELLTYIRLPDYAKHLGDIPVMRDNIKVMCNIRLGRLCGKPKRMLFVVDDLDRCSPAAIVKVLEALRLVLDLEDVIVLIAIDQHIALAALSNHFKEFSSHHKLKNSHAIAREYLSKVINLPIVLTAPSDADVKVFMADLWKDMPKAPSADNSPTVLHTPSDKDEKAGVSLLSPDVVNEPLAATKPDENSNGDSISPLASPVSNVSLVPQSSDNDGDLKDQYTKVPEAKNNLIQALSSGQKNAFVFWVNYFELTNPRQLKRLSNSYDLMRSYFDGWDKDDEVIPFQLSKEKHLSVYPMLLTLILMEYLNSLEDLDVRARLWRRLFSVDGNKSVITSGNITQVDPKIFDKSPIDPAFITAYRKLLQQQDYKDLEGNVKAFVLPAMV